MRSFLYSFLFLSLLAACNEPGSKKGENKIPFARTSSDITDPSKMTTMTWKAQTIDFGKIDEGEKLNIEYHFTNTGSQPLIISRVEPSCGCTMAEVPSAPIQPGKEGVIKATFNSNGRAHANHKTLFVYSNAKGTQPAELSFDVDVQPKN